MLATIGLFNLVELNDLDKYVMLYESFSFCTMYFNLYYNDNYY